MYPSLVLSAALVAPAAPLPRDTVPNVTGPAPRVLALKADGSGSVRVVATVYIKQTVTATQFVVEGNKQVQKEIEYDTVGTQYLNKTLTDFNGKFTTADGRQLTANEATARVKAGATVLASADGQPISKAWLQSAHPDTVVMVADGLKHALIQWGGEPYPTTPPPQLAMLSSQNKGGVLAQVTTQATGQAYHDAIQFEGRVNRIRMAQWAGDGIYYPGAPASEAKVATKPLAEVKFEAYDLNGKLVSRNEALKRLAGGGMVLVAGDNRMPDDAYLKGFREDLLVLVGSELVLPIPPLDQTKKKQNTVKQQIRIFRD
ncbi:hypothetical protein R5W23_000790 [Gemmata sp. JC673]|uniref:Uncharacterized protein n=1 Tax=Gemmata algarum TaxID=2975278 RepID=A0ABU5ES52_9BACT|nr:hypothetical protein [Gemmata algarum]MDY3558069.1 hypothetical protein [Gemmata algarum]